MNITFTGRHLEITDGLRQFGEERVQRLAKHFDKIMGVNVVLSVDKTVQKAEATVNMPHASTIHAHAESSDMYASIDMMVDKLESQLQKAKEKSITERDHGHGLEEEVLGG